MQINLSIKIEKRHVVFLSLLVCLFTVAGVFAATAPNPGHNASAVGPDVFPTGGLFTFPENLAVSNGLLLSNTAGTTFKGIFWGGSNSNSFPHIDYNPNTGLWLTTGASAPLPVNVAGNLTAGNVTVFGSENVSNNLFVGGNATVKNNLTAGQGNVTGNLFVGNNENVSNNLFVGNNISTGNLTVRLNANVSGNLSAGNATVYMLLTSANITANNITVKQNMTLGGVKRDTWPGIVPGSCTNNNYNATWDGPPSANHPVVRYSLTGIDADGKINCSMATVTGTNIKDGSGISPPRNFTLAQCQLSASPADMHVWQWMDPSGNGDYPDSLIAWKDSYIKTPFTTVVDNAGSRGQFKDVIGQCAHAITSYTCSSGGSTGGFGGNTCYVCPSGYPWLRSTVGGLRCCTASSGGTCSATPPSSYPATPIWDPNCGWYWRASGYDTASGNSYGGAKALIYQDGVNNWWILECKYLWETNYNYNWGAPYWVSGFCNYQITCSK